MADEAKSNVVADDAAGAADGATTKSKKFLVYGGKTGWLGQKLVAMLRAEGSDAVVGDARIENREDVARELDTHKPTHVLNAAGLTGRPNVDWCEDHKEDVIRVNVIGTLSLIDLCFLRNIHITNYATGCIYSYDEEHPMGGKTFTEEDEPNFSGSFYSYTKAMVEKLAKTYHNVLVLRVRMPISDDLHSRNFITKICKYRRVVNIPNSMTVLTEMLPVSVTMAKRGLTGVYNFTNPGVISHNQILDLYKKHIDPDFWYDNFTEEEQSKVLKAGRSNNELDQTKLLEALPDITIQPISEAIVGVFTRMAANLKAEGRFPPSPRKPPRDEMQ